MSKPRSNKHEFSVVTKDRVYNLFAESKQVKNAWLKAFNQVITLKNKFKYELEKLSSQPINFNDNAILGFDKNRNSSYIHPQKQLAVPLEDRFRDRCQSHRYINKHDYEELPEESDSVTPINSFIQTDILSKNYNLLMSVQ